MGLGVVSCLHGSYIQFREAPDKNFNFIRAWSLSGRHFAFIAASNYCAHLVIPALIVGNELTTQ
jgi:hypothetical protein